MASDRAMVCDWRSVETRRGLGADSKDDAPLFLPPTPLVLVIFLLPSIRAKTDRKSCSEIVRNRGKVLGRWHQSKGHLKKSLCLQAL